MALNPLFPEIEPYRTGYLKVSPLHEIYWEEAGSPGGRPVVFLHGGPGAGLSPKHRRYFDPGFYRVILFDQRGAGRSRPHAELAENTTWALVEDMEKLRVRLGVDRWLVFGGSWGSTLALAYASAHPARVLGLVLRGIFLARASEIRWLYQQGASEIFPDLWERFLEPIPGKDRGDLVGSYYRILAGPPSEERLGAAKAWSLWEASLVKLIPDPEVLRESAEDGTALSLARLEAHYMVNRAFLPKDDFLLEGAASLARLGIPCRIVHGRYDMVCPPRAAWDLHRAMPGSDLRFVPDAGHSASEPGMIHELVQGTEDFKNIFSM
jgi:proline iminopeptidase